MFTTRSRTATALSAVALAATATLAACGSDDTDGWGDRMVEDDSQWHYRIDQVPDDLAAEQVEITWTPADDRSALDRMGETDDSAEDQGDGPNPDRPAPEVDAEEAPADTGGRSKADYPNFGANSATSDQFARAVYNQFIEEYIATGNTSPSLQVSSPVTGETYTMTCTPSTMYVTCTGGNNANFGIYPPIDDPSTLPGEVQWG